MSEQTHVCVNQSVRVFCVHQESEDAVKALAKEKDLLEREKWDLRRQTKEATEHTGMLRSQLDLKENRIKELEAELAMVGKQRQAHSTVAVYKNKQVLFTTNRAVCYLLCVLYVCQKTIHL